MSSWLDPVRRALDLAAEPATFFFRDDDAGWSDDRLFRLLDLFSGHDLPLDLAVIPRATTPALAREIRARIQASGELIGLHQHGFAHKNHETEGRKCEFGSSRSGAQQERDIESGKALLAEFFGPLVRPIFTPPWNRCTAVTADCLLRLGFRTLSRDKSAKPFGLAGLQELPVSIDWFARHKGSRLDLNRVGELIAGAIDDSEPIGIMFHHALMDEGERRVAGELLRLLATNDRARCALMLSPAWRPSEVKPGSPPDHI